MVDGAKRKKLDTAVYTTNDAVNALIATLRDAAYDFDYSNLTFKYHIDVGLLVRLKANNIPDFPVGTNWLAEGSGHDWLINAIDCTEGKYEVVFFLEEEI